MNGNDCTEKGEKLFGSTVEFFKYYSKPTLKLAQQYSENPNSLTGDEKERLAWEGGLREREILELDESKISPTDPILLEINKRLSIELPKEKDKDPNFKIYY